MSNERKRIKNLKMEKNIETEEIIEKKGSDKTILKTSTEQSQKLSDKNSKKKARHLIAVHKKKIADYVMNLGEKIGRKKLTKKFEIIEDQARWILDNLPKFVHTKPGKNKTNLVKSED